MQFTNDFKAMGNADDALIVKGQREVVLAAISRVISCQVTGVVLDRSRTVVLMPSNGPMVVCDAQVWEDKQQLVMDAATAADATVEVYDGRELWP